jgi:nicotinate phosphoribosyltransferase
MFHGDELEAFRAYAEAMPGNCTFLVDTYDTLDGVRHAVEVGKRLREQGHRMAGIRLDSGDLAWLSQQARRLLDEGGLPDTAILASNELDEYVITALHDQKAAVAVWGVGTRLVTGWGEPALGGVYKLSAVRDGPGAPWSYRVKLSEQLAKTTIPGILQVRRYRHAEGHLADVIYDVDHGLPAAPEIVDPLDHTRRRVIPAGTPGEDLLVPVLRAGAPVWSAPPLAEVRARASAELSRFHAGVKRLVHPHAFPVGLERELHDLRTRLVLEARQASPRRVP